MHIYLTGTAFHYTNILFLFNFYEVMFTCFNPSQIIYTKTANKSQKRSVLACCVSGLF